MEALWFVVTGICLKNYAFSKCPFAWCPPQISQLEIMHYSNIWDGQKNDFLLSSRTMKGKHINFRREYIYKEVVGLKKWFLKLFMPLYLLKTLRYIPGVCVPQFENHCFSLPHLFIDMETEAQCSGQTKIEPRCFNLQTKGRTILPFIVTWNVFFPLFKSCFAHL